LLIRKMTEGAFKDYSRTKNNSFAAVAYWVAWLGNGALLADYNAAHDRAYLNYVPEKMYELYGSQWTVSSLDG